MISPRRLGTYFAAPLFNEMERKYNQELTKEIEKFMDVFLPQRDGGLLVKLVNEGTPVHLAEQKIFEGDLAAIEAADVAIAILDGAHIDEGVAFEIGYAYALGKPCVGLQTDARRALPTGNNPMLNRSLDFICQSPAHLVDWLKCFVEEGRKTVRAPRRTVSNSVLSP